MDENVGIVDDQREGRVIKRIPADTFGHRIMLARAEAGNLTIEQAATRCGLLSQSWGGWERGRMPRDKVDVADAISDGLEIDRDWLLHGGPLARLDRRRQARRAYRPLAVRPPNRRIRRPRRIDRLYTIA